MKLMVLLLALVLSIWGTAEAQTISGFLLDDEGKPLPSAEWPYSSLYLLRKNPLSAQLEYVSSTDCWGTGQGCVDKNGRFEFSAKYDGKGFENGQYIGELWANDYLLKRKEFDLFGFDIYLGVVQLDPQPVRIEFEDLPTAFSDTFEWSYHLTNLSEKALKLEVLSEISAPGETISWVNFPLKTVKANLKSGQTSAWAGKFKIPDPLPDGYSFCVSIAVRERGNPFRVYAQNGFCALKE
ncbi:hypothetical protein A2661_01850 [Candidatus Giovannonibacteria bacterium RIFCSPHIGHO2_01_FULL_45_24]|uniref:Intracellular proteinase inhibitor BsuPI domain-containing protein n=1 Tax=Candidatus Giovannonibacteria bacterium RIFCSPLOWO2_01_FULL_46_32 TaxID=1798353 RepID=A0A1F5XH94_9BACT|nr:MAG: hypothetical protein A2661_01850 [Candidatus Giovannonibacteria bacterium RIFCSPHIGHO2_01_FULL_45_24]OGF87305.1 MAG: hypothetical protein A3B19_03725 [Candidatus Giovannonibacteria bacterium RIFCSPLOWO2_01_FULL_46_32]